MFVYFKTGKMYSILLLQHLQLPLYAETFGFTCYTFYQVDVCHKYHQLLAEKFRLTQLVLKNVGTNSGYIKIFTDFNTSVIIL